jgi:hypothetical protein
MRYFVAAIFFTLLMGSHLMAAEKSLPNISCLPANGSIGGKTPYLRVAPPLGNEPEGEKDTYRVMVGGSNVAERIPFYSGQAGTIGIVRTQVPVSNCIFNTDETSPMIFRCLLSKANVWQLHFHGEFVIEADSVIVYLDRKLKEAPMGQVVTKGFQGGIIMSNERGTFVESVNFEESECENFKQ